MNNEAKKSRLFFKTLEFIKPFKSILAASIVLNLLFSATNALSITLIKPVMQILFGEAQSAPAPIVGTGFERWMGEIKAYFFGMINSLIARPGDFTGSLLNLTFLIVAVFLVKNIFKYFGGIVTVKFEEGIIKSIRDRIFEKMTRLSLDFFSRRKQGSLISIITNDVGVVNQTMITSFVTLMRESLQVILFLFVLLPISIKLTLIAFSTSIVSLIIIRTARKFLRRYSTRMQLAMAEYTSTLQETIGGIRAIKAYNAEKTATERFLADSNKFVRSAVKHKKVITMIPSINEIFAIAALCVVLFVGGGDVFAGRMKADDLMLFLFSLFAIMNPIASVINNIAQYQRGFVAAERIFAILEEPERVASGAHPIEGFKDSIKFENINFSYGKDQVLKDVSFEAPRGKKIALVGASGSGKSTILDLIIRFYDPESGKITIDGKEIKDLDLKSYRSLFGVVSQENILFNDTVAENIRFGMRDITREQIEQAAKLAGAYGFISALPEGFDTNIGDRGVTLSGGERQRIAIARALARDPQILIFDEATSALDNESEKAVQEAINRSLKDKTAIIVAHRLSTIIDCDEIIALSKGRIVERGSHAELMALGGAYRRLYELSLGERA